MDSKSLPARHPTTSRIAGRASRGTSGCRGRSRDHRGGPLSHRAIRRHEKAAKSTVKRAGVKAAAMEASTSVKTAAPAMRAGMGKVRLAEHSSEQQSGCSSSQSPS